MLQNLRTKMQLSATVNNYLKITFGVQPNFGYKAGEKKLPLYLLQRFQIVEGELFNTKVLFAFDKRKTRLTPYEIKKSVEAILRFLHKPVIYCTEALTTVEAFRLIKYRVQFIIPGRQAYLPDFMISIRNRGQQISEPKHHFTPVAQQVFIFLLQNHSGTTTPGQIAEKLGYSNMSVSRALQELENKELVRRISDGRKKIPQLAADRKTIWEKGRQYLFNPVASVKFMVGETKKTVLQLPEAGVTALSKYSMLADDAVKTYACRNREFEKMIKNGNFEMVDFKEGTPKVPARVQIQDNFETVDFKEDTHKSPARVPGKFEIADFQEDADFQLEIWKYNPRPLSDGGTVDIFSLYATLQHDPDERVQAALEEMMEGVEW